MKSVYDILLAPVMTEKSMGRGSGYTFLVSKGADKSDIRRAVEAVFNVKVSKVNVLNRRGKVKNFKGRVGQQVDRRIAIVKLSEGVINYEGGF